MLLIGGGVWRGVGSAVASLEGRTDSPSASISASAPMSSNKGSYGEGGSMSTSPLGGGVGCVGSSAGGGRGGLLGGGPLGSASFGLSGDDGLAWPFTPLDPLASLGPSVTCRSLAEGSGVRSLMKKSGPALTDISVPFVSFGAGAAP